MHCCKHAERICYLPKSLCLEDFDSCIVYIGVLYFALMVCWKTKKKKTGTRFSFLPYSATSAVAFSIITLGVSHRLTVQIVRVYVLYCLYTE